MKIRSRILVAVLAVSLLLSGCAVYAAEETTEPTEMTEAAQTAATETEPAVAEDVASERALPYVLSKTQLPEEDAATGTLCFYLNGKTIHAGSPVSELVEVGFHTYNDLTTIVQPWHMSEVVRVLIDLPDTEEKDEPYLFFVAMNVSDEPCMISDCIIYSITVTCEPGINFGSGKESTHFVSGVSTRDEIVAAYGEPDEIESNRSGYEEIFYYEPFNSVSFSFVGNVVRQINAYYSANVFGALADSVDFDFDADAMEKDAFILMSQYMDVKPYLSEEGVVESVGILSKFDEYFEINNLRIEFGSLVSELPSPYLEDLNDLTMPVERNYYIRTGRHDPEEFYVINHEGQQNQKSNYLSIKGVITENMNYCNWGFDNSAFHEFYCQGVTQNSTIDDVLDMFGQPKELICSSGERTCFAWMHYETEEGDTLRIRVDPVLNQVIEVQMSKYFEKERTY